MGNTLDGKWNGVINGGVIDHYGVESGILIRDGSDVVIKKQHY